MLRARSRWTDRCGGSVDSTGPASADVWGRVGGSRSSRVLALAGVGIALTLSPSTAVGTFVSPSSADYRATQAMYRQFGADPVIVLVHGNR